MDVAQDRAEYTSGPRLQFLLIVAYHAMDPHFGDQTPLLRTIGSRVPQS